MKTHKKLIIHASSLDQASKCLGSAWLASESRAKGGGEPTEAMARGTRIHAEIDAAIRGGEITVDASGPMSVLRKRILFLNGLPESVASEVHATRWITERCELSGTADVIIRWPGGAVDVVDWKTGTHFAYPDVADHLQMVAYAALFGSVGHPVTMMRVHVDSEEVHQAVIEPALAEHRVVTLCLRIVASYESDRAAAYSVGSACETCRHTGTCPAVAKKLEGAYGLPATLDGELEILRWAQIRRLVADRVKALDAELKAEVVSGRDVVDGDRRLRYCSTDRREVAKPGAIDADVMAQLPAREPSLSDLEKAATAAGRDAKEYIKQLESQGIIESRPAGGRLVWKTGRGWKEI